MNGRGISNPRCRSEERRWREGRIQLERPECCTPADPSLPEIDRLIQIERRDFVFLAKLDGAFSSAICRENRRWSSCALGARGWTNTRRDGPALRSSRRDYMPPRTGRSERRCLNRCRPKCAHPFFPGPSLLPIANTTYGNCDPSPGMSLSFFVGRRVW